MKRNHAPKRMPCSNANTVTAGLSTVNSTPSAMSFRTRLFLFTCLIFPTCLAAEPVKPVIDDTQPGWRAMTQEDFTKVNSAADTWTWKDELIVCSGHPCDQRRGAALGEWRGSLGRHRLRPRRRLYLPRKRRFSHPFPPPADSGTALRAEGCSGVRLHGLT